MTVRDVCTAILRELGVLGAAETGSAEDVAFVLGKLNRLFDQWNARRQAVYADRFDTFTLTPSLSPHTIGPTGATWTLAQRPVRIDDAGLILTGSTPSIRRPIVMRDAQWWARQSVKALSTSIPTDLYFEPDWPNGTLFFWPVPDTAYDVELRTRVILGNVGLDDTFTFPPGYQAAVELSGAEACCTGAFGIPADTAARIREDARLAREVIFDNNRVTPRLATRDAGVPGGAETGSRRSYNWLDRTM